MVMRSICKRNYTPMTKVLPPGKVGSAEIHHFTVTEQGSLYSRIRAIDHADRQEFVPPGRYCRLLVDKDLMMSDTPMERETNDRFVQRAYGDVLIAGLGMGMVLVPLVLSDEVKTITVVEKNKDVVDLVAPHFSVESQFWLDTLQAYKLHKLKILTDNIYTWLPEEGKLFDTIYFDIWPDRDPSYIEEMKLLKRSFRPYLSKQATGQHKPWIGCWSETEIRRRIKHDALRSMIW